MRIPNGEHADLGAKIEDYILNATHPEGKHKARVFESVLGITLENADVLRTALRDAAGTSTSAIGRCDNGFGELYVLEFMLTTDVGSGTVLSVWIVRHGEDFPRLVSAYIVR